MNCENQVVNKAIPDTLNFTNNIKLSVVAQPIKLGPRDSYFPQSVCCSG